MIKYIKSQIILLLVVMLGFSSCQDNVGDGYGELQLKMATDFEVEHETSQSSRAVGAEFIYAVKIISDVDNSVVYETSDHTTMPDKFRLREGSYTLQATTGNPELSGVIVPAYMAVEQIMIVAGTFEQIELRAYIAQVKVKMSLSQVMLDNFPITTLTLKQELDDKTIAIITKADIGKEYYIAHTGVLYWTLEMQNTQGGNYAINGIFEDVKARDFLHFDFKMSEIPSEQGVALVNVTLNKNLDIFDHYIVMMRNPGKKPEFITEGSFIEGKPIIVNAYRRGVTAAYVIKAENNIKSLSFYHYDPTIESYGIPQSSTLTRLTQTEIDALNVAGLPVTGATADSPEARIDFTKLCDKLPLGLYPLTVVVIDNNGQMVQRKVTINVMPDDLEIIDINPWGRFIQIKAQYLLDENPGGLTFEYRKKTTPEVEWIRIPESDVMVSGIEFSATLSPLTSSTQYEVRAVSNDGPAQPKIYSTQATIEFPNFDFQTWTYGNKKGGLMGRVETWYPNDKTDNWLSFWSTGNEGTTMTQAASRNITYPDEEDLIRGKTLKMISINIDAAFAKTFAAGNIFTGYFLVNTSDPIMSAKMGRQYVSRPLGVKGEAKYISKNINRNYGGGSFDKYVGTPDKGAIVFRLEKWQNATQNPEDFGGGNKPSGTPQVIADGLLEIVDSNGEWVNFELKLKYHDTKTMPTHVVFTASSSIYGENFCGGEGSTLWLDNLELIWTE